MKQKTIVYVVNRKGKPLMPTTRCGHVAKLLKSGKAVPICNEPFTIKLKYDTLDAVQPLYLGIDTGRENIGAGVSSEKGDCLYLGELKTHNKSVHQKMEERASYRSERRRHDRQSKQRKAVHDKSEIQKGEDEICRSKKPCKAVKIKYPGADEPVCHKIIRGKEGKFNNRGRDDGWITPSARQLVQMHTNVIRQVMEFLPIDSITLERVVFDFVKLEGIKIGHWKYGEGPLFGYDDWKDYVSDLQHGKCLLCGENPIENYHHIIPRKYGGSDKVSNMAGLCHDCHVGASGVHGSRETADRLMELRRENNRSYKVSLLNSVMPALLKTVQRFCKERGLRFAVTTGKTTHDTRETIGLKKTHAIDGYCISLAQRPFEVPENFPDRIHEQERYKKKSGNKINARGSRQYYLDRQRVAVNRHKATDQKEDSLEEFLAVYCQTHTEKEVQQMMHRIEIRPAKRINTYHKDGRICPFHPGDTILYEKHNKIKGNTKRMIFVCTGIYFPEDEKQQKVCHGSKNKKMKFCRRIRSGCTPFVGHRSYSLTEE